MNQNRDKSTYSFYIEIDDLFVWDVIRVKPESIFWAIAKIGGYLSFFSVIKFLVAYMH